MVRLVHDELDHDHDAGDDRRHQRTNRQRPTGGNNQGLNPLKPQRALYTLGKQQQIFFQLTVH